MIIRRLVRWIKTGMTGIYGRCKGKGIENPQVPLFDTNPPPAGECAKRYNVPDPYGRSEKEFLNPSE